ncbi:MAG: DUF3467 domain-containing protein [Pseudomonadota bacterium]
MPSQTVQRRKKVPLARYVNYFEVSHNAVEFLLDFGQYQPEEQSVSVHSRMAFGPTHAKLLVSMLSGAMREFEAQYGAVADLLSEADPLEALYTSLPDLECRAAALLGRPDDAVPSITALLKAKR